MRFSLAAAALLALVALAAPAAAAERTISVNGQGEASSVPDEAHLSAGVTTIAASAGAALAENAHKMTAVFDALKRLGVAEKAIQTSNFSVSPQYAPMNQSGDGPQRIVGYQVSNQVDVTLDDTKKLGPALDALVAAGANQINSVSFAIRDAEGLLEKARKAAIADARKRAETYAAAAGVSVGSVVSIQETGGYETPRPAIALSFRAKEVMPTAAGEESIAASVSVVFELR